MSGAGFPWQMFDPNAFAEAMASTLAACKGAGKGTTDWSPDVSALASWPAEGCADQSWLAGYPIPGWPTGSAGELEGNGNWNPAADQCRCKQLGSCRWQLVVGMQNNLSWSAGRK